MTDGAPINLVFMLEEESAASFLEALLPRILPASVSFQCIPHEGKSDLQRSIPRKLRAWRAPNSFFIILHDLDNNPECMDLKNRLRQLCAQARHAPLIRIACRELEAWYFGDLDAVAMAFPQFNAAKYKNKREYRRPDAIVKPSEELKKICKGFNKGSAARIAPQHMDIDNNKSVSFKHMIEGVKDFAQAQLSARGN